MGALSQSLHSSKIGHAFDKRLISLAPDTPVRAILVLRSDTLLEKTDRRLSSEKRRARIQAVRDTSKASFETIDAVLHRLGGHRLSDRPTALGTVTVETTPVGIFALAKADEVKAILEDQPIKCNQ